MNSTPLKVLQANVARSQKAQHEFIRHFMESDHSVALLCEPYIGRGPEVHNIVGLDIYQFTTNGRPVKACVLIKQEVEGVLGATQYSTPNLAVVQAKVAQRHYMFASIYIEPDVDESLTLDALNKLLFDNSRTPIIIGGDVNASHQEWGCLEADDRGDALSAMAASYQLGVLNMGAHPTFETIRGGAHLSSIVDVSMASDSVQHLIKGWRVRDDVCVSSDHHAIEFSVLTGDRRVGRPRSSTYLFNNKIADWKAFEESVQQKMRVSTLLDMDLDAMDGVSLDEFTVSITDVIRDACFTTMRLRGHAKPYNPWWSDVLERHKRNVLSIHHRLNQKKSRNIDITNEIRDMRASKAAYAAAIRRASSSNFREFCAKQNKENVWSLTSRLIKDAPTQRPPSTLKLATGYTTSAQQTADELNKHFYPDDDIDTNNRHFELRRRTGDRPPTEDEPDFTSEEVLDCLKSMNPNRAPGHDNLTSDICLRFTQLYPVLITRLMNRCLKIGHFPSHWKLAVVKILPKPGKDDYSNLTSFRPIGLLPIFGKLLEKLFVRRLTFDARSRGEWSSKQFGFREQSSTVDALNKATDTIRAAKKKGDQVIAVSLDIKAAFDNAWWPSVFERLRATNCPRNVFNLIQNYFTGRSVSLTYGDATSTKTMTRGCVQGSVCGPTFWNLILDELLETTLPEGCHIQAFADDVLLLITGKDTNTVQRVTNEALSIIAEWGAGVKLKFSANKTKMVAFTPEATRATILMEGVTIEFEDQFRLLGVIIDNKLKFGAHVRSVIRKATNIFKSLCKYVRPTWGVHPENVTIIYKQVIEPIITYAAEVWGQAAELQYNRRILRSFQRTFAIRAIRGFHTVSAVSSLALAGFTPLHLKIREVYQIGKVKSTGRAPDIPEDVQLESRVCPEELPHPSRRRNIVFNTATNQEEVDAQSSHTNIYTDGSKTDDGVGAAFVVRRPGRPNVTRKYRLNALCSVFQAELFALWQSLSWVAQCRSPDVTIFSDSRSGLDALTHSNNTNFLVNNCLTLLEGTTNENIRFVWVKAHVGIIGNEEADEAAKAATTQHTATAYNAFPLSLAKRMIRATNYSEWEEEYAHSLTGSGTRLWFPTLADARGAMDALGTSFELMQIFTGHGYHKEYLKRFKITQDDHCPCDGRSTQSIQHLLKDCNRFATGRHGYRSQCSLIRATPFDPLTPNKDALGQFKEFVSSIVNALKDFNN